MDRQPHRDTVMDIFLLGLRTWLAEMQWLSRALMGRFEIGRLEKELEREYGMLGRIAETPRGRQEEKQLCLKQIDFLKEEIRTLKSVLAAGREARMEKVRTRAAEHQGEEL